MKIDYLADHKELIPILARWMHEEWGYLYPEHTIEIRERLVAERSNKDRIPLTLVAIEDGKPVGTVCLMAHDMDTRPELTPWLASLYVEKKSPPPRHRRAPRRSDRSRGGAVGRETIVSGFTPGPGKIFYAGSAGACAKKTDYRGAVVSVMEKKIQ
jgi:hypothetical protein